MIDWAGKFAGGLPYEAFLSQYGTEEQRRRWGEVYDRVSLSADQSGLLSGFVREMNLLCLAGAWCGDCANQCPILQRIAESTPKVHLVFMDRDADAVLAGELRVCGGSRVPVVVFLSEDYAECGRYGDRTLSRYRELAAQQMGAACPTGLGAPKESLVAVTDDWLNEFERIQLMLRLSPRLRQKHGD